jgi:hypothetical protein
VSKVIELSRINVLLVVVGCWVAPVAYSACPPDNLSRAQLLELRTKQFSVGDSLQAQRLALALLPCLSDPDAVLRDQIAFEALSTWMRAKQITTATALKILDTLQPQLNPTNADDAGFAKPFAALVLSELVRMDRIEPFLDQGQRDRLAQAAASYLQSVSDYRGFDSKHGWRHGVAHGADLLMQLAINPNVPKPALDASLAAIHTQIAPRREHFYVHGEPTRLATAVFRIAERNLHSANEWQTWLRQVTDPAPLTTWRDAFNSQTGLAQRHNTVGFLQALYVLVQENGNTQSKQQLVPALRTALGAVW